ncbi:unnamed protein product [Amoebophrya sp. A25]|nr:unnamed protein product [Amoebophrya sp. A25]|eukprot:GSA25T00019255001.1
MTATCSRMNNVLMCWCRGQSQEVLDAARQAESSARGKQWTAKQRALTIMDRDVRRRAPLRSRSQFRSLLMFVMTSLLGACFSSCSMIFTNVLVFLFGVTNPTIAAATAAEDRVDHRDLFDPDYPILDNLNDLEEVLSCGDTSIVRKHIWEHLKNYVENWMDIPIKDSTQFEKIVLAVDHNELLESYSQECGFGMLVLLLGCLRSLDYNHGSDAALHFYKFARLRLLPALRHLAASGVENQQKIDEAGWKGLLENEDARIEDELVPYGPMLGWDHEFQGDFYAEGEEQRQLQGQHEGKKKYPCAHHNLKIYLYDLPDLTTGPLHCHHGQWGVEALIPEWIRHSECATEDPEEADFFLVPWYTWCQRMVVPLNRSDGEIDAVYVQMMKDKRLKYFDRYEGADHIFLMSDQGWIFWTSWRQYVPHSIVLTTEAFTPNCGRPCFQPWHDIMIPGHTDYFRARRMRSFDLPTEQRPLLFNFHGRHAYIPKVLGAANYAANTLRRALVDIFGEPEQEQADAESVNQRTGRSDDPPMHLEDVPPNGYNASNLIHPDHNPQHWMGRVSVGGFTDDFFERMGASHFCLVPHGNTSWTNHLYNAFFAGCIPVILSDNMEVPFEDLLDWTKFSMKWTQENVSSSLFYDLRKVRAQDIVRMKQEVKAHQCWFDYSLRGDRDCSPYQAIMRVLAKKARIGPKRFHHGSDDKFWGPTQLGDQEHPIKVLMQNYLRAEELIVPV